MNPLYNDNIMAVAPIRYIAKVWSKLKRYPYIVFFACGITVHEVVPPVIINFCNQSIIYYYTHVFS